jgi:hypothetical protein
MNDRAKIESLAIVRESAAACQGVRSENSALGY